MIVLEVESLPSTNQSAKEWLLENGTGQLPLFIRADEQTAGRGRRGRVWASEKGGLYMTAAFSCPTRQEALLFPLKCAVQAHQSLTAKGIRGLALKWPNDIYKEEKKLGGILSRFMRISGSGVVLVGIGVNVDNENVPFEAVTLRQAGLPEPIGAASLFQEWTLLFQSFMSRREVVSSLNQWLWHKGKMTMIKTPSGNVRGLIKGVNADLSLSIETDRGEPRTLLLGEIL